MQLCYVRHVVVARLPERLYVIAGIEPVEELPFLSTKGRTTSKKSGRAAFLDVTNDGSQPLRSEDSSGSVKNLSTEFEPAEVSNCSGLVF